MRISFGNIGQCICVSFFDNEKICGYENNPSHLDITQALVFEFMHPRWRATIVIILKMIRSIQSLQWNNKILSVFVFPQQTNIFRHCRIIFPCSQNRKSPTILAQYLPKNFFVNTMSETFFFFFFCYEQKQIETPAIRTKKGKDKISLSRICLPTHSRSRSKSPIVDVNWTQVWALVTYRRQRLIHSVTYRCELGAGLLEQQILLVGG